MDENKIAAAVQACITDALKSGTLFRSINDSLALLKRRGWTDEERLEAQTRVLQELKRRRLAGARVRIIDGPMRGSHATIVGVDVLGKLTLTVDGLGKGQQVAVSEKIVEFL